MSGLFVVLMLLIGWPSLAQPGARTVAKVSEGLLVSISNKADGLTFGTQRVTQECPTIANTQITTIVACSGQFVNGLEVKTSAPYPPFLIDYIRFDSLQTDPYTGKNGEHLVLAYPWNAQAGLVDITFPVNTGTADRIHYVYACLKPVPADPACRPFALITVTVKPSPPKCIPLVVRRTRVGRGPR